MRKSTITMTWISGLIIVFIGVLIAGVAIGLMLAYGGTYTPAASGNGYDFTPTINAAFWTEVGFITTGAVIAAAGSVMQFAAWIGALVNTHHIPGRTWFYILLVGGVLGLWFGLLGLGTMIAYLIAGPDGMALEQTAPPMRDMPDTREMRPALNGDSATPRPSDLIPTR